jgi:non-specific serine/threonine protein kinase
MGFEDEAEQSFGRPYRQIDGRSKRHANSPHPSSREGKLGGPKLAEARKAAVGTIAQGRCGHYRARPLWDQATDRAFRIGQNKNVLVHKFVCRGTVEDRIDQMIESKQQLAGDFLSGGADIVLTEMKDEELLSLVALDLGAAMKEG